MSRALFVDAGNITKCPVETSETGSLQGIKKIRGKQYKYTLSYVTLRGGGDGYMARFDIYTKELIPKTAFSTLPEMVMQETESNDVMSFARANKLTFHVDESIDFYSQHFSEEGWAYYPNTKRVKAGTLRYRPGKIRLPSDKYMIISQTYPERKEKTLKGVVEIPRLVIANLNELTIDELLNDGFTSVKDAVNNMKQYLGYEDINNNSVVSYYFGETHWKK